MYYGFDAQLVASPNKGLPTEDPAFLSLKTMIDVVPTSSWTFVRAEPKGTPDTLYGCSRSGKAIAAEMRRRRTGVSVGPGIAAVVGPLREFACGVTLVFADSRSLFGVMVMLRTAELGPFTSAEVRILGFGLDAVSDHFSKPYVRSPNDSAAVPSIAPDSANTSSESAFYVLDGDFRIVLGATDKDTSRFARMRAIRGQISERLPPIIEKAVRDLTLDWSADALKAPRVAYPVPFLEVRTQPLSGSGGFYVGVSVSRFRPTDLLRDSVSRFRISPRELQVLTLMLDGHQLDQISARLYITPSTVQDHIRNMIDKTGSNNRSGFIARVLGWDAGPTAYEA